MPTLITSSIQLQVVINQVVVDVMNSIATDLLKMLKDIIDTDVYQAGDPTTYQRTGGFKESWEKSNPEISANMVSITIDQNPMLMNFSPQEFQHGSYYWKDGISDVRTILAEIINEGKSGPLFGEGYWTDDDRKFWNNFNKLFDDGTVDKMVRKAFADKGLKVI